jgi:catechol 2,3-dioxygenase-like lactoylglutathione lyase family enzyme
MTTIAELIIADHPEAWQAVGFAVGDDGVCQLGTVRVRLDPSSGTGVVAWVLAGAPDESVTDVDGLPTSHGDPSPPATASHHPLGVRSIDHVVVLTPDLDRTVQAVERSLGLPLKRVRDGESYSRPVRQAFFRMGEVVLEVVGPPEPDERGGTAAFFGLALTLESLEVAAALLGPQRAGVPKPAVQPGRHITTIRSAAGLRVPVALMDPDPARP